MINRVRTLLMNCGREGNDLRLPGEEYIPADFVRRSQPIWLRRVYTRLFGANPDRLFINYRMRQLMQLIHATPLSEFVTVDDAAITYLPFRDELNGSLFQQVMTPAGAAYLHGGHSADEANGQTEYAWTVQLIAEDTVRVTSLIPAATYVDVPVTFTGGLSSVVPLIPKRLTTSFNVHDVGFSYQVQSTVRPATDIAAVLTTAFNGAEGLDTLNLFASDIAAEQAMYYDIWTKHPQFVMRYAAVCMAIANFTETQETVG